jgi:esterase/lipase
MIILRILAILILVIAVGIGGLWLFGPREPVDLDVTFDERQLDSGVDSYLLGQEEQFDDITEGVEKRVIWADAPDTKTPVAIIYIHGFSATSEEIRPVPDLVAQALGANLYYARLSGHGRSGDAMTEPRVRDWAHDMAEALAVGKAIGDRIIVITTSTGGTLGTLAASRPEMAAMMDGLILVSPNFKVANPLAQILTWPGVRWWGPTVAGPERNWTDQAKNAEHAKYWTTIYPTVATIPMGALVKAAQEADHGKIKTPALAVFDPRDEVVDHTATESITADWGGPIQIERITTGNGDDPAHHVIAGDIMSPSKTAPTVDLMVNWINALR